MKKYLFLLLLVFLPVSVFAYMSGSEVHIKNDGTAVVTSAKVMQIAGPTLFARLYWGEAFIRITVKTDSNTKFFRATGETTSIEEISEGNLLDISGQLESGSNSLSLVAYSVKNSSVIKKQSAFSGVVTSVNSNGFSLNTKSDGVIAVLTSGATTFIKGSRTLDLAHVKVGDTISKTSGDYDIPSKTLEASSVTTYIDTNYYKPKNFQGTLESLNGTTLVLQINGISYTVNLKPNAQILSKNKKPALLARFLNGDAVRIYGAIREVDEPIIDIDIVRDLSL